MNKYMIAKQDLATYSRGDIDTLARYYGVNGGTRKEILWSLAYKIHGKLIAVFKSGKSSRQKGIYLDTQRFQWETSVPVGAGISGATKTIYISKKNEPKEFITKLGSVPYAVEEWLAVVPGETAPPTPIRIPGVEYLTITDPEPTGANSSFRELLSAQLFRLFDPGMAPKTYLVDSPEGLQVASRVEPSDLWIPANVDPYNFMRMTFLSLFLGEADFKPDNVLLKNGKVMRIDFGHTMEAFPNLKEILGNSLVYIPNWAEHTEEGRVKGLWGKQIEAIIQKNPEAALQGINSMITDILTTVNDNEVMDNFFKMVGNFPQFGENEMLLRDWMRRRIQERAAELKAALPATQDLRG